MAALVPLAVIAILLVVWGVQAKNVFIGVAGGVLVGIGLAGVFPHLGATSNEQATAIWHSLRLWGTTAFNGFTGVKGTIYTVLELLAGVLLIRFATGKAKLLGIAAGVVLLGAVLQTMFPQFGQVSFQFLREFVSEVFAFFTKGFSQPNI